MILTFFLITLCYSFDYTKSDDELFVEYIKEYNKEYENDKDKQERFEIFKKNLEIIRQKNSERKHSTDALFGLTFFSDQKPEEKVRSEIQQISFEEDNLKGAGIDFYYNRNYREPPALPENMKVPKQHFYCSSLVERNTDREKVDLCGKQFIQGRCGCCYAAASSNMAQLFYANMTYHYYKKNETKMVKEMFTPQRMMDRMGAVGSKGRCCGGNPMQALNKTGSFSFNSNYQFVDENSHECEIRGDKNPNVAIEMNIKEYYCWSVASYSHEEQVELIKKILVHYGPFSTSINCGYDSNDHGNEFDNYKEGIYEFPQECDPQKQNHQVIIVGYGNDDGKEYFLVKNTWYDHWGFEENYMKLSTKVLCGIGYQYSNYVPNNVLIFAGSCKFDRNCEQCDEVSKVCLKCKEGSEMDRRGMCIGDIDEDENHNDGVNGLSLSFLILLLLALLF